MVRDLTDDIAFDMMVSENLQRQDILPSEEAVAFKNILDRGNTIAYISEKFGKSESFVHSRLILNRLVPIITNLLDCEEISIGVATEIARLEPDIQKNLYVEHLNTTVEVNSWKNLPLKVFREKLETTYTVLLSRFSFYKTECEQCQFNSEIHSLFPDFSNSRCTQYTCLLKK
jgi:ParB family chromosome partitioning protein